MKPQPLDAGAMPLGRSLILNAWLIVICTGCWVLLLIYLPLLPALVLCGIVIWQTWNAVQLHGRRSSPHSIVGLKCSGNGLECLFASGNWQSGRVATGSLVTRCGTLLRWRESGGAFQTHVLVILPDAIDGEDYRRLRVHLRWRDCRET